jgi:hypothetical protein
MTTLEVGLRSDGAVLVQSSPAAMNADDAEKMACGLLVIVAELKSRAHGDPEARAWAVGLGSRVVEEWNARRALSLGGTGRHASPLVSLNGGKKP